MIYSNLANPAFWSRFQFGFTLVFHYLFPQANYGFGVVLGVLEMACLENGRGKIQSSRSILGPDLRTEFCRGSRYWQSLRRGPEIYFSANAVNKEFE